MSKALKRKAGDPFPTELHPMLATLVDKPFDEEGWLYEVKWDGYRALGFINEGNVELLSRNGKSFNDKFYPVYNALNAWKINAVVDGEIVVLDEKGMPDFSGLQSWRSEADGQLAYYLFDILWHNGRSLIDVPLEQRKTVLEKLVPGKGIVKLSAVFQSTGKEFFAIADKMGLEGIIAKKKDSVYLPGARSKDWLKIKTEKRQEAIICGYTVNENTSKPFSALLLGIYQHKELIFIGPVGTGFTIQFQKELLDILKPLQTKACPFASVPDYNKPSRFRPDPPKATVTWVKPKIVCEISYRELTKDNAIRHPSFKGLRPDKNAKDVKRELPANTDAIMGADNKLRNDKIISSPGKQERNTLLNPKDETQTRSINGHELKFTSLSKIYWPAQKGIKAVTKRDMLNYYYQAAPYMLPYYKDKPQTLNRYPHGINGEAFYQKDVKGKVPSWITTFPYHSNADERDKEFMVCTDEASLLYIASLGCIEINPWSSRRQKPDNPDWCIIDLDPDKNTFQQVIEAAHVTKLILDAMGVPSYPKTSGSTGIHIYIPLGAKYTYEDSKEFARIVAKLIHAEIPSFTSIERKTSDRGGKMYIDFLQNRPQATVAGPYSLRPKPGAPVSMPLHWEEVRKGLTIQSFNIFNAIARLKEAGDIFKPVLGKGINIKQALKKVAIL